MILDIPTLFAVNVLCSLVFATATLLAAYVDRDRTYWRHWCLCFSFGVASLFTSTFSLAAGSGLLFMGGHILLVPTFYFYYAGSRGLAGHHVPIKYLYIALAIVAPLTAVCYSIGPKALSEVPAQIYVIAVAISCTYLFSRPPFQNLSSRYGFICANLLQTAMTALHIFHSVNGHYPIAGLTEANVTTAHLLATIIYTVLTGTFLFSLFHERSALENKKEALKDPLTDAYNRRAFDQYLKLLLARSDPPDFALMHFDLDHFKSINDRFGHASGDEVLIAFVKILRDVTPQPRFVARLGGEEFAVIASDITNMHARETADLIRQALETTAFTFAAGGSASVTTSVGLYCGNGDGLSGPALMDEVDKSLYEAKRSGRNRVVCAQDKAMA